MAFLENTSHSVGSAIRIKGAILAKTLAASLIKSFKQLNTSIYLM